MLLLSTGLFPGRAASTNSPEALSVPRRCSPVPLRQTRPERSRITGNCSKNNQNALPKSSARKAQADLLEYLLEAPKSRISTGESTHEPQSQPGIGENHSVSDENAKFRQESELGRQRVCGEKTADPVGWLLVSPERHRRGEPRPEDVKLVIARSVSSAAIHLRSGLTSGPKMDCFASLAMTNGRVAQRAP